MAGDVVWEDRQVRFDNAPADMRLTAGEKIIDTLDSIEDTKGNNGEKGQICVTNLRIMWRRVSDNAFSNPRINLSIGLNCIINIYTKPARSILRGTTEALYILTKFGDVRFEFIFTNIIPGTPRLFTTVIAVHRAYETTKTYRDFKLRTCVVNKGQLIVLPLETIYSQVNGVWNLSSDQGNLGMFFITNIRVVWVSNTNEAFNVSVPYLQMKFVKVRDSKFGKALVVATTKHSGEYMLGFRIDPIEKAIEVTKEIQSLLQVFGQCPIFGVQFETVAAPSAVEEATKENYEEEVEIDLTGQSDAMAAYFADTGAKDGEPVYSEELGLAIEKLPPGVTLAQLWDPLG